MPSAAIFEITGFEPHQCQVVVMQPDADTTMLPGFERVFCHSVEDDELVWHRDKKHRVCKVLEGEGWAIQMDNSMPYTLKPGDVVLIPREVFHRLLKGSGDLRLMIVED